MCWALPKLSVLSAGVSFLIKASRIAKERPKQTHWENTNSHIIYYQFRCGSSDRCCVWRPCVNISVILWKCYFAPGHLLHINVPGNLSKMCCKIETVKGSILHLPSLGIHFCPSFCLSSVRLPIFLPCYEYSQAALRGSDALHLGWSLVCSVERKRLAGDTWKHQT